MSLEPQDFLQSRSAALGKNLKRTVSLRAIFAFVYYTVESRMHSTEERHKNDSKNNNNT